MIKKMIIVLYNTMDMDYMNLGESGKITWKREVLKNS